MRHCIIIYIFFLFSAALTFAADRPSIIVIFTDDHGYSDLSCQGIQDDVKTPHIDKLALGGVRMTSGYVTAPQCVPSRAGLLSGRYQNRFGVESNGESLAGFNALQTIAERPKIAGFATGMTGKWHLGPQQMIVTHGFDDVYYKNANRPGWANFALDGSNRPPGAENSKLYHLDVNSQAACAFIKRHQDEPFFFTVPTERRMFHSMHRRSIFAASPARCPNAAGRLWQ
jgi:arylsulfatase A-like enzyme